MVGFLKKVGGDDDFSHTPFGLNDDPLGIRDNNRRRR